MREEQEKMKTCEEFTKNNVENKEWPNDGTWQQRVQFVLGTLDYYSIVQSKAAKKKSRKWKGVNELIMFSKV